MLLSDNVATIQVFYYMPDHKHLIQWLIWQTEDISPKFPRVHQYLNHWKDNIEATIEHVMFAHVKLTNNQFRNGREFLKF